jgi:TetR/AcrR family transcriptional regulator, regulator of autoinduction and epiphytic fitness
LLIQHARVSDDVPEKAKQMVANYSTSDPIKLLIPIFIRGQQLGEFCEGDPYKFLFCYFSIITGLMLQEMQTNRDYWIKDVDTLLKIIKK